MSVQYRHQLFEPEMFNIEKGRGPANFARLESLGKIILLTTSFTVMVMACTL